MAIREVQNNAQAQRTDLPVTSTQRLAEQMKKTEQVREQTFSAMLDKNIPQRETNIVANAVAAFAKSTVGKLFEENTKIKNKDKVYEADFLKDRDTDDPAVDQVTLQPRGQIARIQKQLTVKQEQNKKDAQVQLALDNESRNLVEQYTQVYGKAIASQSGVATAELEQLERKLKTKGFATEQLMQLKLSIKQSLRGAVVQQIKDAYLKRTLSLDMVVEYGAADIGLSGLLDEIVGNAKLGGEDFGGYPGGLQGATDAATEEVARDIRIALKELLDQKMTERLVSNTVDPKKARAELEQMLKIGGRVGFDPAEYMRSWYKEKIDQGLFVFQNPDMPAIQAQVSQQQDQGQPENPQGAEQTEEFLLNRLRALYIRSAIKDDWRTSLDTSFKIIKTKNKMIKLGVFSEDVNERVKQEAVLIASGKIMEMLNETYLERATLYRLQGPAYKLVETKLAGLLKNAQKLGMEISDYELQLMRDRANLMVFDLSKRELKLTMVALAIKKAPAQQDKKKKLIMLLERLKQESGIVDEIGLSDNELTDRVEVAT